MWFFDGWQGIWRTALVGVLAYLALVVLLRVSGKRTLSKMNAFDLVVTVALGSTLATILLSSDVALAEGLTALGVLILMQFVIAWPSVRSERVSRLVKSEPALLAYQGRLLLDALRRERVVSRCTRSAASGQPRCAPCTRSQARSPASLRPPFWQGPSYGRRHRRYGIDCQAPVAEQGGPLPGSPPGQDQGKRPRGRQR